MPDRAFDISFTRGMVGIDAEDADYADFTTVELVYMVESLEQTLKDIHAELFSRKVEED